MHNRTIIEFEECLSNNKTVKSVYKLRSDLEWIEKNIGQPFNEWTIWHVCTAWNVVREEYLKKFKKTEAIKQLCLIIRNN